MLIDYIDKQVKYIARFLLFSVYFSVSVKKRDDTGVFKLLQEGCLCSEDIADIILFTYD